MSQALRLLPFLVGIGLLSFPVIGFSQLFTSRSQLPVPDSSLSSGFLPGLSLSAEMNSGYGSVNEEQAWNYKLQGIIHFTRIHDWVISGTLTHEQSANPYSDINFNPKRAWWTETISLTYLDDPLIWQTGIYHRCKHDIDNAEATNPDDPEPTSIQRGPILTGLFLTAWLPENPLVGAISNRNAISVSFSLFGSDYRSPTSPSVDRRQPRNDETVGSVWFLNRLSASFIPNLMVYQRLWGSAVIFEKDGPGYSFRFEWGLRLHGVSGYVDAFGGYEYQYDDFTDVVPRPTGYGFIGVRVSGLGWE